MTEHEQLEYNDALVGLASIIQQQGVKRVLMDMQIAFPQVFNEIKDNIQRFPAKPAPALLRK
jgi:hypothetical protein